MTVVAHTSSSASNGRSRAPTPGSRRRNASTRNGATTMSPAASPSHHVSQIGPKSAQRALPVSASVVTPRVALTVVLTSPASATNLKMSCARSKAATPPAKRSTRNAPTSASSVLPAAMPSDESTDPAVVRLTAKAPAKIAGQMPRPSSSTAASAMPVGGQTGVAFACTMA